MNTILASFICVCGIGGLFYLDRDKTLQTSKALWLPILWIIIAGSRPITSWFSAGANVDVDASPIDVGIYGILLAAAVAVLVARRRWTKILLVANWPILLYFFFCLISVTWSFEPDVSFKRWIKAIGDLAMVLVIVTDRQPMVA